MADFVLNNAGLIELCKAEPMQAGLKEVVDKMANAANADARSRPLNAGLNANLYGSRVDVLDRTAVGIAYTKNELADRNEDKYKSLTSQCH